MLRRIGGATKCKTVFEYWGEGQRGNGVDVLPVPESEPAVRRRHAPVDFPAGTSAATWQYEGGMLAYIYLMHR